LDQQHAARMGDCGVTSKQAASDDLIPPLQPSSASTEPP